MTGPTKVDKNRVRPPSQQPVRLAQTRPDPQQALTRPGIVSPPLDPRTIAPAVVGEVQISSTPPPAAELIIIEEAPTPKPQSESKTRSVVKGFAMAAAIIGVTYISGPFCVVTVPLLLAGRLLLDRWTAKPHAAEETKQSEEILAQAINEAIEQATQTADKGAITVYSPRLGNSYELEAKIGQGGMGIVYSLVGQPEMVVKVLLPKYQKDKGVFAKFIAEFDNLVKIQHPNVQTVFDLATFNLPSGEQTTCIIMQRIEGKAVYDLIQEARDAGQPIEADLALDIIIQAAEGLAAADKLDIHHRDADGTNLMVNQTVDPVHTTVIDFGISQTAEKSTTGSIEGKYSYIDPLTLSTDVVADKVKARQGDMYQLLLTLREMVTLNKLVNINNRDAFDSFIGQALSGQHQHELPMEGTVTDGIQQVLVWGLSFVRADRFETYDEFITALRSARAGQIPTREVADGTRVG
ncbi:MAG: protein kinase [bacterium]